MRGVHVALAAIVMALVAPTTAAASPAFGPGCVTIAEFQKVRSAGPGISRARVHNIFGAKGVSAAAGLFVWKGPSRVYGPCDEAAWDRHFGDGPKSWIVQSQ